ncbi:MAG: PHP domain-containing protein [Candidatus Omnitrophica bacterium]|nr:PHP domain-containing protein [Candidatus Omnitrophota bacterium]
MRYADLHTHTIYSDGTCTPEELVDSAVKAGLYCVAICDHDVVDAVGPALDEAARRNIEVVPAIELSANIENGEVHILGYFIDHTDRALKERVAKLKEARVERVFSICDKLKTLGVDIRAEDVLDLAGPGSVGRLHIARFMHQKGYISSVGEAFRKYIGDRGPAYVNRFRLSPPSAIDLIVEAGGVPVLAHPYSLPDDGMIEQFVSQGIKGIEVFYPEHTPSMIEKYRALAARFNLFMTGGSDFHGKAKDTPLGSVRVPYELVERLKNAR